MSNCKYKTPCGICTVRTGEDPTPTIHYCQYEEKCTCTYPKADSHKAYWDNVGTVEDLRGDSK